MILNYYWKDEILRLPLTNQKLHTLLYWLLPIGDWSLKCWQKWGNCAKWISVWDSVLRSYFATLLRWTCYGANLLLNTVKCGKWTSMWDDTRWGSVEKAAFKISKMKWHPQLNTGKLSKLHTLAHRLLLSITMQLHHKSCSKSVTTSLMQQTKKNVRINIYDEAYPRPQTPLFEFIDSMFSLYYQ